MDQNNAQSSNDQASSSPADPNAQPAGKSLADEAAELLKKEGSNIVDVTQAEPVQEVTDVEDKGGFIGIIKKKKSKKALYIGIGVFVVIIAVGIFVAFQYLSATEAEEDTERSGAPAAGTNEPTPKVEPLELLPPLSDSDEIESIESDLNATDVADIDSDIDVLETELSQ